MSFEIEGKLIRKYDIEGKTPTFQTREFVIETDSGNYAQFVKFQLVQERCTLIDNFSEGEQIKVHFDLRGREWQGKYFTNLNAWRIEKAGKTQSSTPAPPANDNVPFPTSADEPTVRADDFNDDLPF